MAIQYNEKTGVFTLQTKNTTYQMQAGKYGLLLHLYYGRKVKAGEMDYLLTYYDRGFSGNPYEAEGDRTFSMDVLPQEYPSYGTGDYRTTCLEVINEDGSYAQNLRYQSHEIKAGKYSIPGLPAMYGEKEEADTLQIVCQDAATGLQVTLYYGVFEEVDVITRAVRVTSTKGTVVLKKVLSTCLDLPAGNWDWMHFYGRHAMERQMERGHLQHGTQSIGSIRGSSSHQHNPFFLVCGTDANEEYGDCYGFNFVYSGNFIGEVEVDQMNQTRINMGIHSGQFSYELQEGESFDAPEVILSYSANGLSQLSENFHQAIRYHICRGAYKTKPRPILINNWEATYFDFNSDKLVQIAEDAAQLGIEMLVMDDGWFGKRNDDNSGLGDWFVNETKINGGLAKLASDVNALGLKLGIWFEPEMVSEDSDLYRTHPDWSLQIPGRKPVRSRNQLLLDLSRTDVRDYLYNQISSILESADIEYIKWDMNRSICDAFSAVKEPKDQGKLYHQYVLGLYELLEKLVTNYPKVLFEGCSGGGGRFDAGMLYYTPQIWCSDNTDAIERLEIQYGTSFGYPISAVGSHVSASPNHQTGRAASFATRGAVAMAGSFGYELDINKLTLEEKEEVKVQIQTFKKYWNVIHNGRYSRLIQDKETNSWQFTAHDGSEALVTVIHTHSRANAPVRYLRLRQLLPDALYQIEGDNRQYPGSALMHVGIPLPVALGDHESLQYHLIRINDTRSDN